MNNRKNRRRGIPYKLLVIAIVIFCGFILENLECKSVQAVQIQNNSVITQNTPIMGKGSLDRGKMLQILYNNNKEKNLTYLGEFVDTTINEANIEGVDYDVAFSLMMLETAYLNFGGDVQASQNNFGGLGATGNGVSGESFSSMRIGIRAVVQHLKAYGSTNSLNQACVDKRFTYVKRGCIPYVEYLGIQENPDGYGWAAGVGYGTKIKNIIQNISAQKVTLSQILGVNVSGNMKAGKAITIEATATPTEDSLYRIWVKDNGNWSIISDYSTDNKVSYIPKHEGQFAVQVDVKNRFSNKNYDDVVSKLFTINKPDLAQLTAASVTGQTEVNMPITIEATATPAEDTLYRVWIKENGSWRILSEYNENNKITYTPTKSGTYAFEVQVKNKFSTNAYDGSWSKYINVTDLVLPKLISGQIVGDMKVGNPLTINATSDITKDSLYRVWIKENGSWRILNDFSTNSSITYTPTYSGTYAFEVQVKNKYSTNVYDSSWSKYISVVNTGIPKITNVQVLGDMKVGSILTISATANITKDTLYKVWIKENGSWRILNDFSTNSSITYTPTHSGAYAFEVQVKNKYSTNAYDSYWSKYISIINFDIPKILNVSLSGDMKAEHPINISTTASITKDTLYRVWIKENGSWRILNDFGTNSSITYTPTHGGTYAFEVQIKNKYSNNAYDSSWSKYLSISNSDNLILAAIDSVEVNGMINLGRTMTISAKAKNTEGTLYRVWIKENGNWNLISDYSNNSTVSYVPKYRGPYAIQVDVKNKNSANNYDDVWCEYVYTKPKDITIVLDPGHGLSDGKYDTGAVSTNYGVKYIEAELNLRIAQKVYLELINRGYNVIMTRGNGNGDVDFYNRPTYANNNFADLYISIHQNSFTTPAPNGVEVLYTSNSMDDSQRNAVISAGIQDPNITHSSKVGQSAGFANILANGLSVSTGFSNRGAKDQNLFVCRNTFMPAVLIECGFISNPDEAIKLSQEGYQDTISRVIAISVDQYYK